MTERVNHVSKNLSLEDRQTIEDYLLVCEEHESVCSTSAKKYQKKHEVLQFISGAIVVTGIGTTAALGPFGAAVIPLLLFTIATGKKKGWHEKASKCRLLAEEFGLLIEDLIEYRRGTSVFNHDKFSSDLARMERMMKKHCPAMIETRRRWQAKHPKPEREEVKF